MASNIELKARARDFPRQCELARAVADSGPIELHQRDTFFHCRSGRLKLREFGGDAVERPGELIEYERADEQHARESRYERIEIPEPRALRGALTRALGERLVVVKHRTVFLSGRTRIHLDRVEGLGEFLELEVVLEPGDDPAAAHDEARALMRALEIGPEDVLADAYVDLLVRAQA